MSEQTLITIGAGPKSLALAAKATALESIGVSVPKICIIEKNAIAANWKGQAGFTNGRLELGTSPEKDVGFPYSSAFLPDGLSEKLNREMFRFSWVSYLIGQNRYSEWIDRGRPAPTHGQWAEYLCYVAENLSSNVRLLKGNVDLIRLSGERWQVRYRDCQGEIQSLIGDGLVLTGPGRQKATFPTHFPAVLSLENFWERIDLFRQKENRKIAVVGNGENAASMLLALLELDNPELEIELISPVGFIYSRGESYFENRVYSNPDTADWGSLSMEHRREFVRRTDLGVFSQAVVQKLNQSARLKLVPGILSGIDEKMNRLELKVEYAERTEFRMYDNVVLATGFDQGLFLSELLDPSTRDELRSRLDVYELDSDSLSQRIDSNLALEKLRPRLHLPMLSGTRQGPGFANLSCLGSLADRILRDYIKF